MFWTAVEEEEGSDHRSADQQATYLGGLAAAAEFARPACVCVGRKWDETRQRVVLDGVVESKDGPPLLVGPAINQSFDACRCCRLFLAGPICVATVGLGLEGPSSPQLHSWTRLGELGALPRGLDGLEGSAVVPWVGDRPGAWPRGPGAFSKPGGGGERDEGDEGGFGSRILDQGFLIKDFGSL